MLYIRHGPKLYKNGDSSSYPLDPPLTPEGKNTARNKFRSLLQRFGPPPKIVSSPYLRARETAKIAQDVIFEDTGKTVPIVYDSAIGEYLGHQKNCDMKRDLYPETLQLNPLPPETWNQYSYRVRTHFNKTKDDGWYITHGLVINSIAFFHKKKFYPSELEGIFIDSNHDLITI